MVLDGYDHIVDVTDNDGASITQVAKARNHHELSNYLDQIRDFEVRPRHKKIISVKVYNLLLSNTYCRKIVKDCFSLYVMTIWRQSRRRSNTVTELNWLVQKIIMVGANCDFYFTL